MGYIGKLIILAGQPRCGRPQFRRWLHQQSLRKDVRFYPSWAEAHERTLASLNNGRPPYSVKWQGCILLKQGTKVDVIDHDDWSTEILISGKHWFADE